MNNSFKPIRIFLLFILIPSLSWGLTFKDGKQVDGNNNSALETVLADDIIFASGFYTEQIKSCTALYNWALASDKNLVKEIKNLVSYDWQKDWENNSTCVTVAHEGITIPMTRLMSATHTAVGEKDTKSIEVAISILVELANSNTLYETVSYNDIKNRRDGWEKPEAKNCWYHAYAGATQYFTHYIITSIWIKEYLNEQDTKTLNSYIDKMYKKFVNQEYKVNQFKKDRGIYSFANNGLSVLAYAHWNNDIKLAKKEINIRFKEFNKHFYDDGYINNNSFRGVRAQWYHSYGLNAALGYVYIANTWGVETPDDLLKKLINSSNLVNLAINNYEKFRSRKWVNPNKDMNDNWTDDPQYARMHTHQDAVGISYLMKEITGVELLPDSRYLELQYVNGKDAMDNDIGFPPKCI